ncbi:DEAD/DEAH box helicase [Candidatus Woesearchaeota archaeon]|jgi:helicase|nr:DEAD/DEAH box helicase [Candidatus Woesearchaeota archaeon]MBT4368749.1 DEAD/DEAH box helicase [Candidatus Woesearchaeota archaeon]MBT4712038.1 DEAD/DEAH box helicase [Candidatus Woesearchaeota archaeon]MBT6639214.1 DEAD/DEAH box helicase [Candidatus Woesearchaeota archaeon]MBT7134414.1 DEAD/DEAH box helicase [Candidatus Woesearchaeota archaeon]
MDLIEIKSQLPEDLFNVLNPDITELRPSQEKAIGAGLLEGSNLLVCTPTASGKTLIAEIALIKSIMENKGKGIYIVPLRALATEKFKEFKKKYEKLIRIAVSIGNMDSTDSYLADYDLIFCTSEKLDSLIRHNSPWLKYIKTVVVDEIHLLNDLSRGPTLEVTLTILKTLLTNPQIIGLSATIGNPKELADWLEAKLVQDSWRPVELKKGVYLKGNLEFLD